MAERVEAHRNRAGRAPAASAVVVAHTQGMARALGALFAVGPLYAVVQLVLSANHYRFVALFTVAFLLWEALGLALLTGALDNLPGTLFKAVLFVSTVAVSVAVYAAGAPSAGMFFYYLWVTPYAFVFYSRAQAAAQVGFVGVCSAAVLAVQLHQHPALGSYTSRVPIIVGVVTSLVVIGALARRLTATSSRRTPGSLAASTARRWAWPSSLSTAPGSMSTTPCAGSSTGPAPSLSVIRSPRCSTTRARSSSGGPRRRCPASPTSRSPSFAGRAGRRRGWRPRSCRSRQPGATATCISR